MRVNVLAFGTQDVEAKLEAFRAAANDFFVRNGTIRTMRDQNAPVPVEQWQERDAARQRAREAFDLWGNTIRMELATL